jgi:hypothetical protein
MMTRHDLEVGARTVLLRRRVLVRCFVRRCRAASPLCGALCVAPRAASALRVAPSELASWKNDAALQMCL